MSVGEDLMSILACPKCKGDVHPDAEAIVCDACGFRYPVRDGIPILLAEAASDGRAVSEYARHTETDTESLAFYEAFYAGYRDYRRHERADAGFVRTLFRRLALPADARVLDLGSGSGYFHSLIGRVTDHRVYSADFSFEGFRAARDHYGLNDLAVMDAYDLAFKEGTFDAVLTIGLTPFKKTSPRDVVDLIRRIVRPLKTGGWYVFVWSTNLSGRVEETPAQSPSAGAAITHYYNHTRRFIHDAFVHSDEFSEVKSWAFIRPFSHLFGRLLLSGTNTILTELLMKVVPRRFSARLLVIGRKK